jgi:DNA polymerase III subunit epsilon
VVATVELIVKPDGWTIPEAAARVHGITTEIALASGVPLRLACAVFTNLRAMADLIVAHNWEFDRTVLAAAVARTGAKPAHPGPAESACTMQLATPIMMLPPTDRMRAAGFTKYKPPNLTECVQFFLGEELPNAHSALVDVQACRRVYFEIRARAGQLKPPEDHTGEPA